MYGVAVVQEEEQLSANQKVSGLTLGFPGPHVKVSIGQDTEPYIASDVNSL